MKKQSILKLLLICAFAAAIYFMDMYVLIPPTKRTSIQSDGTGTVIGQSADRAE